MTKATVSTRIKDFYAAFNRRDASSVIELMTPDVRWPRAFEGDFIEGKDAVRSYWQQQWSEINPIVEPVSITEMEDGRFDVEVHQVVHDLEGNLLFDGTVHHFYEFDDEHIASMEVDVRKTDLGTDH